MCTLNIFRYLFRFCNYTDSNQTPLDLSSSALPLGRCSLIQMKVDVSGRGGEGSTLKKERANSTCFIAIFKVINDHSCCCVNLSRPCIPLASSSFWNTVVLPQPTTPNNHRQDDGMYFAILDNSCVGGIDINFWFAPIITIYLAFLRKVCEFSDLQQMIFFQW